MKDTIKKESFRGLYKGLLSPVIGEMAISCCFFGFYGMIKDHLGQETVTKSLISGAITGAIISSFVTPVELVKIRLQINTDPVNHKNYKGLSHTVKEIVQSKGGVKNLYHGLSATLVREVPFTASYFVTYEYFKKLFHKHNASFGQELFNSTISGGLSGMVSWGIAYPADVLKSIIQSKPEKTTMWGETQRLYKSEGIKR